MIADRVPVVLSGRQHRQALAAERYAVETYNWAVDVMHQLSEDSVWRDYVTKDGRRHKVNRFARFESELGPVV